MQPVSPALIRQPCGGRPDQQRHAESVTGPGRFDGSRGFHSQGTCNQQEIGFAEPLTAHYSSEIADFLLGNDLWKYVNMWARILKLSANPRRILRNILALDDSAHAIALGVAIGIFFGLTPTVGIQTVFVVATVAVTRRFFYFNAAAAVAATYVSNPITMVPMYYFWYRLGAAFIGGNATAEQLELLIAADSFSQWWQAVCTLGLEIGAPMFLGALITAPVGAALAYIASLALLKWLRDDDSTGASGGAMDATETANVDDAATLDSNAHPAPEEDNARVAAACLSA